MNPIRAGAGIALFLSLTVGAVSSEPETVTIRGEAFQVWPVEDLNARGFDIPPAVKEDNAAWAYIDAINAYEEVPPALRDALQYAAMTAWPGEIDGFTEYLDQPKNRRAIRLAVDGTRLKQCRMPYFGDPKTSVIGVLLPHLSSMRHLSKLMTADGRRLESEGKDDEAIERYLAVMRMGQHVNSDFTLIEGLVGMAVWTLGQRALVEMVLREPLTVKQLRMIQGKLTEFGKRLPTVNKGLWGERTFGPAIVDEVCSRPLLFFSQLRGLDPASDSFGFSSEPLNANPADGWGELEFRIGRLIYPDRAIKRHMLEYYDKVLEEAEKGPREAKTLDAERYIAEEIPKWDVIPRVVLPSLSRAIELGERLKAEAAMARAVVAIRLYSIEHDGRPPPDLTVLAERLPEGVFFDPFGGRDLVYRSADESWIVYSVGPNLVDDGGQQGEQWDEFDRVRRFPPEPVEPFEREGGGS
ncbi:MAG: hypothetical protein PVI86_03275 [Phycisphaerae bacterium]|jgi:hypothetical protein